MIFLKIYIAKHDKTKQKSKLSEKQESYNEELSAKLEVKNILPY